MFPSILTCQCRSLLPLPQLQPPSLFLLFLFLGPLVNVSKTQYNHTKRISRHLSRCAACPVSWQLFLIFSAIFAEEDGDQDDDGDDALGHCTLANGTCGHTLVRKKLSISKQTSHSRSSFGYAFVPISRPHFHQLLRHHRH